LRIRRGIDQQAHQRGADKDPRTCLRQERNGKHNAAIVPDCNSGQKAVGASENHRALFHSGSAKAMILVPEAMPTYWRLSNR
jgi:hypothetical protein